MRDFLDHPNLNHEFLTATSFHFSSSNIPFIKMNQKYHWYPPEDCASMWWQLLNMSEHEIPVSNLSTDHTNESFPLRRKRLESPLFLWQISTSICYIHQIGWSLEAMREENAGLIRDLLSNMSYSSRWSVILY